MIYTITCDGELLFDPRLQDYALQNPVLDREANRAGTLTFTIYPNHPMYGQVHFLKSRLKVYRDGTLIFIARPSHVKRNFRSGIEYKCEEILAALDDVLFRPSGNKSTYPGLVGYTYTYYVGLAQNNISMPLIDIGEHSPNVGKIDGSSINYKTKAIADDSYPTCLELLQKEYLDDDEEENYLLPRYGTYHREGTVPAPREGEDCLFPDIYAAEDLPICSQTIEFGRNMAELFIELDKEDFFTALIPLGADKKNVNKFDDSDDTGVKEDDKIPLTINRYGNTWTGPDYIEDADLAAEYGHFETTHKWEKVKDRAKLQTKGHEYYDKNFGKPFEEITLSAIDLAYLGNDYEAFDFMHKVRVISELHGVDDYYIIKRMKIPLGSPDKAIFEFGDKKRSMTDRVTSAGRQQSRQSGSLDNRIYILENT